MRLWSIHPKYLDRIGLVALWREALLAKKVLEGKTKGYKNHPQLERFKKSENPIKFINKYLWVIYNEAKERGYNFDKSKFKKINFNKKINVTSGQLKYEIEHLFKKIKKRAPKELKKIEKNVFSNPIFKIVKGKIEDWEKIKNRSYEIMHYESFDHIYKKFGFFSAPKYAKKIIKIFNKNNSEIFIAGGFVRDVFLKQLPEDIDFVTNLNPQSVERLLKKQFLGEYKKIELQGKVFGVIRIVFNNGENYEIATFRKDGNYSDGIHPDNIEIVSSLEQDAKRRDLTINALFYNPIKNEIMDYVGGLCDLETKKLRFVGNSEARICEDKSRMLRYIRFLLKTNFVIDKKAKLAIHKHALEIKIVPNELIKKELDKIILLSGAREFIELLDDFNLLKYILPEIKDLENSKQGPPHHMEGDVFKHTKMVCDSLPKNSNSILKWVGVFHDIGKPESRKEIIKNGEKIISFLNHEKIGIEKLKPILRRLKFSKKESRQIIWFIKNHLIVFDEYFLYLENNNLKKAKDKIIKSLKRLINKSSEKLVFDLMSLALADIKGSVSLFKNESEQYMKIIFSCFDDAKNIIKIEDKKGININEVVDGKIIMKYLGIKSGKTVGKIKKQIIEKLSDKYFEDKKQLQLEFKKILKKLK